MSAQIEFYDNDGATLITERTWPVVFAGNSGAKRKFAFKNTDVRTWASIVCSLAALPDNDGIDIARFALDTVTLYEPLNPVAAAPVSGGSFTAGTYYLVVTAISAIGETIKSAEVTVVVTTNQKFTLSWDEVPGADGYRVYLSAASGVYGASSKYDGDVTPGSTISKEVTSETVGIGTPPADNTTAGTSGAGDGYGTAPTLGTADASVGNVVKGRKVFFWERNVTSAGMANAGNPRLWDLAIVETG